MRSVNFTSLVTGSKGVRIVNTNSSTAANTTQRASSDPAHTEGNVVRRRSSSFASEVGDELPPSMQIIGSISDYGLGNVTWWQ